MKVPLRRRERAVRWAAAVATVILVAPATALAFDIGQTTAVPGDSTSKLGAEVWLPLASRPTEPTEDEGPPYRIGGNVTPPRPLWTPRPIYPEGARLRGAQGLVTLEAVIAESGEVTRVRALQVQPMNLDGAARDTVQYWKFLPATLRGEPVAVYVTIKLNFEFASFDFGPAFTRFLDAHPELGAELNKGDWLEAKERLNALHEEPLFPLALAYVALWEQNLREAWEDVRDTDLALAPVEVLHTFVEVAAKWATRPYTLASDNERDDDVDIGLEAATIALTRDPYDTRALRGKDTLLRIQAERSDDKWERAALLDEARELEARVEAAGGVPPLSKP